MTQEKTEKIRAFRVQPGIRIDYVPSMTINPDDSDRGHEPRTSTVKEVVWINPRTMQFILTNGKVVRVHPQAEVIVRGKDDSAPMVGLHYHNGIKDPKTGISLE